MKKVLIGMFALAALFPCEGFAGGGGFGGGFVGGLTGSMVGGAIMQPREKTVVVQQPIEGQSYVAQPSKASRKRMKAMEKENDDLREELEELKEEMRKMKMKK
jgi:hypothetical protein